MFHSLPTGALAWNADQLSSGSRDRVILQRDIRAPPLQSERRLQGHRQEVCGLKWSTDHQLLASGGNDNKVHRQRISPVLLHQHLVQLAPTHLLSFPSPTCFTLLSAAARVEPLQRPPGAAVHRALGCSEGHRLVSPPARLTGLWWRHRRPLHPLLEHSDRPAAAVHRHRLSSLQPGLVQAHKRTGECPQVSDPDSSVVKKMQKQKSVHFKRNYIFDKLLLMLPGVRWVD